jgi:hypothetical protein
MTSKRNVASPPREMSPDERLDLALEQSFPASGAGSFSVGGEGHAHGSALARGPRAGSAARTQREGQFHAETRRRGVERRGWPA